MFKFDFKVDELKDNKEEAFGDTSTSEEVLTKENNEKESIKWYDAVEVKPTQSIASTLDFCELNSKEILVGATRLRHIVAFMLLEDIKAGAADSEDIKKSEEKHSDLIPAVYEGGAKIWECTDDMLKYLSDNYVSEFWINKRVLDLGCGAGLLGIYTRKNGSITHFQDYNRDVLERITIPNVLLNSTALKESFPLEDAIKNAKFYAGDWAHFTVLTENDEKYDLILTSETIYNPDNQEKLLDTFSKRLKTEGSVLVAAKSYYFGVGGGLRQFEKLVQNDKRFKSEVLWLSAAGVNREILELKFY